MATFPPFISFNRRDQACKVILGASRQSWCHPSKIIWATVVERHTKVSQCVFILVGTELYTGLIHYNSKLVKFSMEIVNYIDSFPTLLTFVCRL